MTSNNYFPFLNKSPLPFLRGLGGSVLTQAYAIYCASVSPVFSYWHWLVFLTNLVDMMRSPDKSFTETLINSVEVYDLLKIKNSRSSRLDTLTLISPGECYDFHY